MGIESFLNQDFSNKKDKTNSRLKIEDGRLERFVWHGSGCYYAPIKKVSIKVITRDKYESEHVKYEDLSKKERIILLNYLLEKEQNNDL